MRAGKLRHLITVEEQKETQDQNTGDITIEWVKFKQTYAQISPLSGKEYLASGSFQNKIDTRIKTRFDAKINSKMRIFYRGVVYNIEACLPDDKSGYEHLTMLCSGGVNNG